MLDANSTRVIGHYQANRPWHPASITKLMTAYTVFRNIASSHIDSLSPVRISAQALAMPPSKIGFPAGTILTMDNALKIIMVKSANDVAYAIAQSTSGSHDAFIIAMNDNARRLGMHQTHFTNPHGLPDGNQVTSARDMALLALALQNEFPQHAGYFNIHALRVGKSRIKNHNRLLFRYLGTNGFKTGYTCASGLNIVARAKRGGRQLIAVVLGGNSSAERNILTAQLLNHGFNDRYNWRGRKTISQLQPKSRLYAVPANLRPMICKPSWSERQLTKKQRRKIRKEHLARLKALKDKYLNQQVEIIPPIKIKLGGAFGANPYNYKLLNGGAPSPVIGKPQKRPDKAMPPHE